MSHRIHRWYVTENGRVQQVLDSQARRRGLRPASEDEIRAQTRRRPCGCRGRRRPAEPAPPPIVRWLGVEWIGTPWPKRLRVRSPVYVRPAAGCGCIAALKRWTEARRLGRFARTRRRSPARTP